MSRIEPFDLTCEISDVSSKELCYNACFCEAHRRENRIKMVVPEVVETRDTIKLCVKLDISQLKCLVCYKELGMLQK